jgi:hypothetical protein
MPSRPRRQPETDPNPVELFRRICELNPIRSACLGFAESEEALEAFVCRSTDGHHCAECLEHLEGRSEICRQFGLDPVNGLLDLPTNYIEPKGLKPRERPQYWAECLEEAIDEVRASAR